MAASEPDSLSAAVSAGERRRALEAIRDRLALELESGEFAVGSAAAAVSKELRAVLAELEGLAPAKGSKVDELSEKRAKRRAATVSKQPAKRQQRRARGS